MPKTKCIKCGEDGECFCMVVDDKQSVNEFTFVCISGHVLKECKYVGEYCPFCNLPADEHNDTPQSLWSSN